MSVPTPSRWTTPSIDVTITPEHAEVQIKELILRIKPTWKSESVKLKKLHGGILNLMYVSWNAESCESEDSVVVRVHQRPREVPDDHPFSPKNEIDILEKISPTGLGPELIVLFNNGLCYKYIPGKTLNVNSVRTEKFIPHVTKLIARLHSLPLTKRDRSWTMDEVIDFVPDYPPTFRDPTRLERVLALLPDYKTFKDEVKFHLDLLPTLDSPKVFCHMDTKGENFVWNEKNGTLRLVDFEHSGNNTQAFEIGGHFASYNDVLGATPDTYPDREFQLRWIRMYLEYWYEFTGRKASDVTDKDVQKLYIQSNKCAQAGRIIMGVGLLRDHPGLPDCFEFSYNFLKDYFKYKDEVNAMVLPE